MDEAYTRLLVRVGSGCGFTGLAVGVALGEEDAAAPACACTLGVGLSVASLWRFYSSFPLSFHASTDCPSWF
uniref:Uncharacterized protein n=1 Tax=Arundo donax TaxID=35708 RepID=A0A0A9B120_ARUDO